MTLDDVIATGNTTAVNNPSNGTVLITRSEITGNVTGTSGAGDVISFGDNRFSGNGNDGSFTTATLK